MCNNNALCVNTYGSYQCQCMEGYTRAGSICQGAVYMLYNIYHYIHNILNTSASVNVYHYSLLFLKALEEKKMLVI